MQVLPSPMPASKPAPQASFSGTNIGTSYQWLINGTEVSTAEMPDLTDVPAGSLYAGAKSSFRFRLWQRCRIAAVYGKTGSGSRTEA
jgi:hypothetical protein